MNTAPGFGFMVPITATGVVNFAETSTGQPRQAPAANPALDAAHHAPANPHALAELHFNSLAARMLEWQTAAAARPAAPCESQSSSPPDQVHPEPRTPTHGLNLLANAAINSLGPEPGAAQNPLTVEAESHSRPTSPHPFSFISRDVLEGYLIGNQVSLSHLLAHQGNTPRLVELLLHAPDQLHARDAAGNTPLHVACRTGQATSALALLNFGANPHVIDKSGITPLHLAAELPQPELTKLLIDRGAPPEVASLIGNTPLHRAAFHGRTQNMAELLNRGAAADRPNLIGVTALHAAAGQGHLEAVKLLISFGASPFSLMKHPSGRMATPRDVSRSPAVRDYLFQVEIELDALLDGFERMAQP